MQNRKEKFMFNIMPNRMDRIFFQYQEELENKALEVLRTG